jgi:type IV secretion system protein VirD4
MQLPATEELVLVSGCPPIRAKKVRYYEDRRFMDRILPPLKPKSEEPKKVTAGDDWSGSAIPPANGTTKSKPHASSAPIEDSANAGIRREPELPEHENVAPEPAKPSAEFVFGEDEPDDEAVRARVLRAKGRGLARQAAMDPGDGIDL